MHCHRHYDVMCKGSIPTATAAAVSVTEQTSKAAASNDDAPLAGTFTSNKCYFCGNSIHNRRNCPVRNCVCVIAVEKGGIMQKFAGKRPLRLLQNFAFTLCNRGFLSRVFEASICNGLYWKQTVDCTC